MEKSEFKQSMMKFIERVDFALTNKENNLDKVYFKTELSALIAFVKEFYHFDSLRNIEAV